MKKYILIKALLFPATHQLFSSDGGLSFIEPLPIELKKRIILSAPGKNFEGIQNLKNLFITGKSWNNLFMVSLLDKIAQEEDPNLVQKSVRMLLKGNEKTCLKLFKQSAQSKNVIAQLYLPNIYHAIKWSKDAEKDFNKTGEEFLESYMFSHRAPELIKRTLIDSGENEPKKYGDWKALERQSTELINEACRQGNLYAHLVRTHSHNSFGKFGMLYQLKSSVAKSKFPELLYCFGASLFGSRLHIQHELAGLRHMEQSGFLKLKFFEDEKDGKLSITDFRNYCDDFVKNISSGPDYYDNYGMRFIDIGTVLAPSKEHWKEFKKEKLDTVSLNLETVLDFFSKHNIAQIRDLKTKYDLVFDSGSSNGLPWISIDSDGDIGKIRITNIETGTTSDIILQDQYKELNPVIVFLKDVLTDCVRNGYSIYAIGENLNSNF